MFVLHAVWLLFSRFTNLTRIIGTLITSQGHRYVHQTLQIVCCCINSFTSHSHFPFLEIPL